MALTHPNIILEPGWQMLRWKRGANKGVPCQRMKYQADSASKARRGETLQGKELETPNQSGKAGRWEDFEKSEGTRRADLDRKDREFETWLCHGCSKTNGWSERQLPTSNTNAQLSRPGTPNESRMRGLGRSKQRKRSFSIAG